VEVDISAKKKKENTKLFSIGEDDDEDTVKNAFQQAMSVYSSDLDKLTPVKQRGLKLNTKNLKVNLEILCRSEKIHLDTWKEIIEQRLFDSK